MDEDSSRNGIALETFSRIHKALICRCVASVCAFGRSFSSAFSELVVPALNTCDVVPRPPLGSLEQSTQFLTSAGTLS